MVSAYRLSIYSGYLAVHRLQYSWLVCMVPFWGSTVFFFFSFYTNTQTFVKTHASFFFPTLQLLFSFNATAHRFLYNYTNFVLRMKFHWKNKPLWEVQRAVVFFRRLCFTNFMAIICHWDISIAPKRHRLQ